MGPIASFDLRPFSDIQGPNGIISVSQREEGDDDLGFFFIVIKFLLERKIKKRKEKKRVGEGGGLA